MANFNEKINSHKELFLLDSEDYVIKRVVSMDMLESEFDYNMRYLKIGYRLFIQYKDTCRAQGMAGRCYMWSCTSNTRCGGDVRKLCLDRDGNGDLDNFGNPKFDYIAGAVLITDKYVLTYGDTWFEAVDLEEKHVVCNAYVCGLFVSEFSIPAEVFDRLFGLKENFPDQYEKVFGKAEDAKPVRVETLENDKKEKTKKTKMADFNEKVNCGIGYILNSKEFFIYRTGTIKEFARLIHNELYLLTNTYRLFIQYKTTHRAKKMAGRCFLWDNSHGDHMADPGNGIELRSINDASQDDCEGFGNPRFDGVSSAILITDSYVFVYGDMKIEVDDISKDNICTVSLCGSIVSCFRIPAETFDRLFGLKENFPELYEKRVKTENDLIEEAKRNIESCMNLLDTHECQLERAMDAIQAALMDIGDHKCELGVMLSKLDNTLRKLKQGFELSGNSE